jgi:hypothetical protein
MVVIGASASAGEVEIGFGTDPSGISLGMPETTQAASTAGALKTTLSCIEFSINAVIQ